MAKKVRRRPEEGDETRTFQFPEFDEKAFLEHEFEQGRALGIAFGLAVGIGVGSWAIQAGGLPWYIALVLGILVIILTPFLIRRIRPGAWKYKKGDWAGLIAMQFFLWLGLWFILLDAFPKVV